jgi:cell fate regulator YaaT (PSP1 superfamily)
MTLGEGAPPGGGPPSGGGPGGGSGGGGPGGGRPGGGRRRRRRGRGGRGPVEGATARGSATSPGEPNDDGESEPDSESESQSASPAPSPAPPAPRPPSQARGPGDRRGPRPPDQRRGERPPHGPRHGDRPPQEPRGERGGHKSDRPPQQRSERQGDRPPQQRGERPGDRPAQEQRRGDRPGDRRGPPDRRRDDRPRAPERPAPPPSTDAPALQRPSAALDSGWGLPDAEPPAGAANAADGAEAAPDAPEVARTPTPPPAPEPRDPFGDDLFVDLSDEPPPAGTLTNIAGVKFRDAGTIYEYDAGESSYRRGDRVMVESDRGPLPAVIAVGSRRVPSLDPLRRILRLAQPADDRALEKSAVREREAWQFCRQRIRDRGLRMKLVRIEYPLQSSKVLIYFASEERIDFRDLVKDLAQRLHARIEMRQIGARDEAKMVGGIGSCGRELCCSTWLPAFVPVSIKMAKDQGLVLNPSKVSGQCGRLKCCLVYEQEIYKEMRKTLPKVGKRVSTPAGDGKVVELDVLRQLVRVWFDEGGSETFPAGVVQLLAPAGPQRPEPEPEPEPETEPES